jgi:hypothetical protein
VQACSERPMSLLLSLQSLSHFAHIADSSCPALRCVMLCLPGYVPCINYATHQAPFACLFAHLQRLWDYSSCVEAQLKIWLAHYLLAAANPGGCTCSCPTTFSHITFAQITMVSWFGLSGQLTGPGAAGLGLPPTTQPAPAGTVVVLQMMLCTWLHHQA